MSDMTDKAIAWIRQQTRSCRTTPLLAYFVPGSGTHLLPVSPSGPTSTRARSTGSDRAQATVRQAEGARRDPRDASPQLTMRRSPWEEMPEKLEPVLGARWGDLRGLLEFTDHHGGRVLGALEELGVSRGHLVYYIISDNGARPRAR